MLYYISFTNIVLNPHLTFSTRRTGRNPKEVAAKMAAPQVYSVLRRIIPARRPS